MKKIVSGALLVLFYFSLFAVVYNGQDVRAQPTVTKKYLAVYYTAITQSGTSYATIDGKTYSFTSAGGGVFCYIPELNTTTLVQSYFSPDYAPNYIIPYTVGDRLVLVQVWTSGTLWTTQYQEVNPNKGNNLGKTGGVNYEDGSFNNYALVNNSIYYVPPSTFDMMAPGQTTGGDLCVEQLGSYTHTWLLSNRNPDNYGSLYSAGGRLFRINIDESSQLITINQISLVTGKIEKTQQLYLPLIGSKKLTNWFCSEDQNAFYIASQYNANATSPGVICLFVLPLTSFDKDNWKSSSLTSSEFWNSNFVYEPTLSNVKDKLTGIDANDGNALLTLNNNTAILYDSNTAKAQDVKFPHGWVWGTPQLLEVAIVQLKTSTITLQSSSANVTSGQTVTLSGAINPSASGNILLSQSVNGSVYQQIANVTLTNGTYSYQDKIPEAGTYKFQASFAGNSQLKPAQSSTVTVGSVKPTPTSNSLYIVGVIIVVIILASYMIARRHKTKPVAPTSPPPPP